MCCSSVGRLDIGLIEIVDVDKGNKGYDYSYTQNGSSYREDVKRGFVAGVNSLEGLVHWVGLINVQ